MSNKEIEIGKLYRVKDNLSSDPHNFKPGALVVVRSSDKWDQRLLAESLDGSDAWYVLPEDLQEVQIDGTEIERKTKQLRSNYKVGDQLIITDKLFGHGFEVGTQVVVIGIDDEGSYEVAALPRYVLDSEVREAEEHELWAESELPLSAGRDRGSQP